MSRKKSLPVPKGGKVQFTKRKKEIFLKAFAECNSVKRAASLVGFSAKTIYDHLKDDEEFKKAFDDTNELIVDALEAEAYRRAKIGMKEPVYFKGQVVGHKIVYSDRLLEMLLSGRSDRYKKKSEVQIKGEIDHKHSVESAKTKLLDKLIQKGITLDGEAKDVTDQGEDDV